MRKTLFSFVLALVALVAFLRPENARASHAAGGELMYKWVRGSTYDVYMKFYRDCSGIPAPNSFTVCYDNTCNNFSGTLTLNQITGPLPASACGVGVGGQPVITGCAQYPTTCQQPTATLPGYEEYWYYAQVTLAPQPRCNFWRFSTSENARNSAVDNITGGGSAALFVEATLYSNAGTREAPGNSSPCFTIKPVPYVNNGIPFSYNMGAVDPDGDSLTYQLIMPRDQGAGCSGTPLQFMGPQFNLTNNPLETNGTFNLNPTTGQITFTSSGSQVANIAILVREYQRGVLRGTSMRDIQIISLPGSTRQPQPSPPAVINGGQANNGRYEGCAGQYLQFCFDVKAIDTNAVLVATDNHNNPPPGTTAVAPGSSLTYTSIAPREDSLRVCFEWLATGRDTGLHNIIIRVRDTVCRPPGTPNEQIFSLPIYIYATTNILSDTTICAGETATLLATGGTKFQWSVLPGGDSLGTLSSDTARLVTAKPSKTTSYVVTSNLQSVCGRNRDTVTVTVPEAPVFNRLPDQTTCVNSSVLLDLQLVPKAGTYYAVQWTPSTDLSDDTSWAPVASPDALQTQYIVTIFPGGLVNCAVKDTINVFTLQGFDIANRDTAICIGNTIQVLGINPDTRYTYSWTPVSSALGNPNAVNTTITPTAVGIVSYAVKASYPGCPDSMRSFIVDAQPTPIFELGADRAFCAGDTAKLNPDIQPPYPNYTYVWTPGGLLSNSNIPDPIFFARQTTTLKLDVSTTAGCKAEDSVTFTVTPADFVRVAGDTMLCPGDSAALRVTGVSTATFVWRPATHLSDTSAQFPFAAPITSTTYTVYAKDTVGCVDSASIFVEVKPQALMMLPDTVNLYPGDSVQFNPQAAGANVLSYYWSPSTGLDNENIANPIARPAYSTLYIASGVTEYGCKTSDSVFVRVMTESLIQMPNAFAPSNDPNSFFKPAHQGTVALKTFRIYNRWGKLMYQTKDLEQGWDGKVDGDSQPMGVYVYIIEGTLPSGRNYYQQGDFTLIR